MAAAIIGRASVRASERRRKAHAVFTEQQKDVRQWLDSFDHDHSGSWNKVELKIFMTSHGKAPPTDEDVYTVFKWADKSRDGELFDAEILFAVATWTAMLQEKTFVDECFAKYDTDGSGMFDLNELKDCLTDLNSGEAPTEFELKALMNEIDSNHTGTVESHELIPAVQRWFVHCEHVESEKKQAEKRSFICALM